MKPRTPFSSSDETGLGMPIIIRERYDSLDRVIRHDSYAFSYENEGKELSLKDTATALMDTMIIDYRYSDSCNIESMDYWTHAFGHKDREKTDRYTFFDTLGRETRMYKINEKECKLKETVKTYHENSITTVTKSRHADGRLYYHVLDTVFLDTAGLAIKKSIDRIDKESENKVWRKCHDCQHHYFRDDSSNIRRISYQEYGGRQLREEFYEYENGKVKSKTSRVFGKIGGDTLRLEIYDYDKHGSLIYWETQKRNRIDSWQRHYIDYKLRKDPAKD